MAKRKTRGLYHGYLVLDKPAGWTSHDLVGKVRRVLGERRVGHAGTLDPAATGVLPIAIGLATRTVEYLSDASKAYVADITFGVTTDSVDIDGTVLETHYIGDLNATVIAKALRDFDGDQLQIPPMHSAIKVDGVRLYERARRGEITDVEARPITIHEIRLLSWAAPMAQVYIACSKGTYIRSLARDLGAAVGTGAYMSNLVRVRSGPFFLADTIQVEDLEHLVTTIPWEDLAWHPDAVMDTWPAVILNAADAMSWRQGKKLDQEGVKGLIRVYDQSGTWLGVGQVEEAGSLMKPVKVVAEA